MKYLCLFILGLLAYKGAGAQFIERIYLKDSSMHQGWIVEQVPQAYLKILRQTENDTITVNTADVLKIVRVLDKHQSFAVNLSEPERIRNTAIFVEAGANSMIYSLNVDNRFNKKRIDGLGYRVGIGLIPLNATEPGTPNRMRVNFYFLPVGINYLLGKNKSAIEIGAGATMVYVDLKFSSVDQYNTPIGEVSSTGLFSPTLFLGYRYTANKGFMFKAGACLLKDDSGAKVLPGLSLGYTF